MRRFVPLIQLIAASIISILITELSLLWLDCYRANKIHVQVLASNELQSAPYKQLEDPQRSYKAIKSKPRINSTYNPERSMRKRASVVLKRCKQIPSEAKSYHKYIATFHTLDYAYMPIAKCGWTTWTYVMFADAGKERRLQDRNFEWGWGSPYEEAGMHLTLFPERHKERLLFVREPYDRLVSAYKDKALYGQYCEFVQKPCGWLQEGMPKLTFTQFVGCIIDKAKSYAGDNLSGKPAAVPLDIHWTPQYWSAQPCSSNYTLIGRFNHMKEDVSAAISILKLNATYSHKNQGRQLQNETLGFWYNQLPDAYGESLKQLYKMDFQIFGFDDTIPS